MDAKVRRANRKSSLRSSKSPRYLIEIKMSRELEKLLKMYARLGLQDWKRAPAQLKSIVTAALANRVATDEWEAGDTINAARNSPNITRCRFIPMPEINHGGMKRCFFLPIKANGGGVAFDLLLLVDGKKWLGLRFEPADLGASTHGYGHVQMCTSMCRQLIQVKGIPQWLPTSYPAIPIRTSEPVQSFFSMATSVHGYQGGIIRVMQEVFQNRPGELAQYITVLKALEA